MEIWIEFLPNYGDLDEVLPHFILLEDLLFFLQQRLHRTKKLLVLQKIW
jgi:hypothetical protein